MTISTAGSEQAGSIRWTAVCTVLAVCGVVGSLWLSLGMNLKACPLCLYQRAFMASAAAVLLTGLLTDLRRSTILPLLALPAVFAGLGVAGFHEYLEMTGKLECPAGLFGVGSAPQQSVATFLILAAALLFSFVRAGNSAKPGQVAFAAVLGVMIAFGTIKSAPPMPAAPTKPYDQPLEICRPPYQPT